MISKRRRFSVLFPAIGLLAPVLSGCGEKPEQASAEVPVSSPVYNPDPKGPLQGVGIENEREHLDKIKQATAPGAGKK